MTEWELFECLIPEIAELTVKARKMKPEDYQQFRAELLSTAEETPCMEFMEKVLRVIEHYRA